MITIRTKTSRKAYSFLDKMRAIDQQIEAVAHRAGQRGVEALRAATPVDTGLTASSWSYEVETKDGKTTLSWINTNRQGGINIAIILQYGHGTGTGGWVAGQDYLNPAVKPIFDDIVNEVWKKVKSI